MQLNPTAQRDLVRVIEGQDRLRREVQAAEQEMVSIQGKIARLRPDGQSGGQIGAAAELAALRLEEAACRDRIDELMGLWRRNHLRGLHTVCSMYAHGVQHIWCAACTPRGLHTVCSMYTQGAGYGVQLVRPPVYTRSTRLQAVAAAELRANRV